MRFVAAYVKKMEKMCFEVSLRALGKELASCFRVFRCSVIQVRRIHLLSALLSGAVEHPWEMVREATLHKAGCFNSSEPRA
jgi:hypothetical protein